MEGIVIAFLKGFKGIEKHLIPVACSIVLMLLTYSFWNTESQFLLKIGVKLFMLLFFSAYLIIFELLFSIISIIKTYINKLKEENKRKIEENKQKKENDLKLLRDKEEEAKRKEEVLKQRLDNIWGFIDTLDNSDYAYLKDFVESGNTQINIKEDAYFRSKLFNSKLVHCTVLEEAKTEPIQPQRREPTEGLYMPIINYERIPATLSCVLTDETYDLLKISKSTYGRISHFIK